MMSGSQNRLNRKRLNGFQRVGAAELKQNHSHTPCCLRHPPGFLKANECYSNIAARVNEENAFSGS